MIKYTLFSVKLVGSSIINLYGFQKLVGNPENLKNNEIGQKKRKKFYKWKCIEVRFLKILYYNEINGLFSIAWVMCSITHVYQQHTCISA